MDFSPDGRFLAGGGRTRDQKGKVVVWDVRSGNIEQEFPLGGEEIYSVRFAADSRLIAAGGFGNEVVVLELGKPEPVRRLKIANGTSELLFSPDGKVLVASGNGGFISMWSVATWEKIFQLDALIGIRGVFDFHLVRGDLAFDGEAGLVRVLPKVLQQKLGNVAVEVQALDLRQEIVKLADGRLNFLGLGARREVLGNVVEPRLEFVPEFLHLRERGVPGLSERLDRLAEPLGSRCHVWCPHREPTTAGARDRVARASLLSGPYLYGVRFDK